MARTRLSRAGRYEQLVEVSWALVREEGADALTLGRLAERAGVAKPVVYSHFASRAALLAALFKEFDDRQTVMLEEYLDAADESLNGRANAIADSYVGCSLAQGRELTGVLAALEGSPELERVKRESEHAYSERCREVPDSLWCGRRTCATFDDRNIRCCRGTLACGGSGSALARRCSKANLPH